MPVRKGGTFLWFNVPSGPCPPLPWFCFHFNVGDSGISVFWANLFSWTIGTRFQVSGRYLHKDSLPLSHSIPDPWAGISREEFGTSSQVPVRPLCFPHLLIPSPPFQSCLKPRMILLPLIPCVSSATQVYDLCLSCTIFSLLFPCWVSPLVQAFSIFCPYHCSNLWLTTLPL